MHSQNVALQGLCGFDEHEADAIVKVLNPSKVSTEEDMLARLNAESNSGSPSPT